MNDAEYHYLTTAVRRLTGIDLDAYKAHQMRRRLEGFLARAGAPSMAAYVALLQREPAALRQLRDFLTINVTEFFRDPPQFQMLREEVLPALGKRSPRLSIWSAGCSTGAEPYSVALLLEELWPGSHHRILATDVDDGALDRARAGGPYTDAEVRNVPRATLLTRFTKQDGGYWVAQELRHRVTFQQHNLLRDPFPTDLDLVLCRNVVIYFSDEAKAALYARFHRALKPHGVLFTGGTETLYGGHDAAFQRLGGCFYRKAPAGTPAPLRPAATARPVA